MQNSRVPWPHFGMWTFVAVALPRILILFMSEHAFGRNWPQLESGPFRFRDPLNKNRRFLPCRLDDAELPGALASFRYVDFRGRSLATHSNPLHVRACFWPELASTRVGSIPVSRSTEQEPPLSALPARPCRTPGCLGLI